MSDEGFLRRWSRRKTQSLRGEALPPEPAPAEPADADTRAGLAPIADVAPAVRVLPTLDDVALLTPDADFSAFVAREVDPAVRRGALKKLFADPHFNAMDGLDVYIDDYTKPSPVSDEMLAALSHARSVFRRPDENKEDRAAAPVALETDTETATQAAAEAETEAETEPEMPAPAPAAGPAAAGAPCLDADPAPTTIMTTTTTPDNEAS